MVIATEDGVLARKLTSSNRKAVRGPILLSALALLLQVGITDYGAASESSGAAVFWFAVGMALLGLVYFRRSRTARLVAIAIAMLGVVVYGLAMLADAGQIVLVVAYLAQALPLMTPAVRRHVQR